MVNDNGNISSGSCDCPRGKWICSHMAATAIYANKIGFSKTDLPNSWIAKPKKETKKNVKTMMEFFPSKKPCYQAIPKLVSEDDTSFLFKKLPADCPMKWIIAPETEPSNSAVEATVKPFLIEDILEDFIFDKQVFIDKFKVSPEQISWLAEQTKEHRNCETWGRFRRLRLTGSNFGDVLAAVARHMASGKPYPASLFKKLKGEYCLGTKDCIMWGQMHEDHAIKQYMAETGNNVEKAGLYLFPCGYLGSTPDGIIISLNFPEKGVLEVKCPWKHRNLTISEMVKAELGVKDSVKGFYLDKNFTLNQEHNYWHQVQGEMAATNTQWAHFVVWTVKELKIILVQQDPKWVESNLSKLQYFYENELLPNFYCREE